MKVILSYWPEKEAMLATLVDNVISQVLTESKRIEIVSPDTPFREIIFDTSKRKRHRKKPPEDQRGKSNKQPPG